MVGISRAEVTVGRVLDRERKVGIFEGEMKELKIEIDQKLPKIKIDREIADFGLCSFAEEVD